MKRRLINQIFAIVAAVSMITQIPALAVAAPEKSDARNSVSDDLVDYMDDFEKVADTIDDADKSFDKGVDESDDGDEKAAIKEFQKSYKKFQKADESLDDLDAPKSAKNIDDMTSEMLDKYKKGTKMMVKAEKSDDGEKADEAKADEAIEIMNEGVELEDKVVASFDASILLDEASSEDSNEAKIAGYVAAIQEAPDGPIADQAKVEINNIANKYVNSIGADIATANTTIAELDRIPEGAEFTAPEIFGNSDELGRIAGTLAANPNTADLAAIFNKLAEADNSGSSIFAPNQVDPVIAKKQRDTTQRLLDEAKTLIGQG